METKELIGKIIIQENIDTIHENKIPKTFVINVPDPYKSYYSRFTDINKPTSIIFVTKTPNSFENILRVTKKINETYNLELSGAKCEVAIGSRKLNGIRVKGINRYPEIEKIQQYYKDEGFDFAKSEKFKDTDSLIRINRFFNVEEIDMGIYHSLDESNVHYVEIPRYISWEEFRNMTFEIKNNITDSNYDIAKGIFYVNGGITEMLRIVKPKISIDLLKTIQKKYIEKLL
ncbi:hypothetical protein HGB55_00810 [Lutibacter sp. B1]|nr:hypothetical protein [Lutibacter sp. B1]